LTSENREERCKVLKKRIILLLAMIIIMIPSYSFGAITAHASGNDAVSSALETIPPICVSGSIYCVSGSIYDKTFNFNYEDHAYAWDIQVPSSLVNWDRGILDTLNAFYANGGSAQESILKSAKSNILQLIQATYPTADGNDTSWIDEPQNDAYVRQLSLALLAQGEQDQFDKLQDAGLALSFVQSIPYVPDQFPRLAAQTLVDNGDCDDRSILLVGLLKDMNIDSILQLYTPQTMGLSFGHMNVGIAVNIPDGYSNDSGSEYAGNCYYVAETTNRTPIGYAFAETPDYTYRVI
jgi:hypothetical protein